LSQVILNFFHGLYVPVSRRRTNIFHFLMFLLVVILRDLYPEIKELELTIPQTFVYKKLVLFKTFSLPNVNKWRLLNVACLYVSLMLVGTNGYSGGVLNSF
jgi:hypothetical protein